MGTVPGERGWAQGSDLPQPHGQSQPAALLHPSLASKLGNLLPCPPRFLCWELTVPDSTHPSPFSWHWHPGTFPRGPAFLLLPELYSSARGPTFVVAGEQPEVLCLFLEVLLPDFLDLNQVEDS